MNGLKQHLPTHFFFVKPCFFLMVFNILHNNFPKILKLQNTTISSKKFVFNCKNFPPKIKKKQYHSLK